MPIGVYVRTPENKKNISLANKKAWKSPIKRAKFLKSMKETLSTPEHIEMTRNNMKKQWARGDFEGSHQTPEFRESHRKTTKERWDRGDFDGDSCDILHSPEAIEKHRKSMKETWAKGVFDGVHQTPEAKKNHRLAMERQRNAGVFDKCYKTQEFREKQSKLSKQKWENGVMSAVSEKNRIKSKEQWASGRMDGVFSSPTTIETMLYKFLEENNIPYTKRKTINIGYKTRKPDSYIEPNIIIEADGTYHHSENCHGKDKKEDDIKADAIMKEMGYIIYRIPEPDFRNGKYVETLQQIMNEHKILPIKNDFGCDLI